MDPVALLLDKDSKEPSLLIKPIMESKVGSSALGIGASAAQAASSGAALLQLGQLYEVIVTDPNLLSRIMQGTAEFVPGKIAGTISSQIRAINGPAIGTGFLRTAGSSVNYAVGIASICGAVASIAMEMRLQAIEAKLGRILDVLETSINIEMTSRLDRAIEECRRLHERIAAVELSAEMPTADVLLLQRTDVDRRIYDIQKTAAEVSCSTKAWLEKELAELNYAGAGDATAIVERLKQMWNIQFTSLKLCILSRHIEREKERLRGGTNLASFLETNFVDSCKELKESHDWLEKVKGRLGEIRDNQAWYKKLWNLLTGRNKDLVELIQKQEQFSQETESHIELALLCNGMEQRQRKGSAPQTQKAIRGRFAKDGVFHLVEC